MQALTSSENDHGLIPATSSVCWDLAVGKPASAAQLWWSHDGAKAKASAQVMLGLSHPTAAAGQELLPRGCCLAILHITYAALQLSRADAQLPLSVAAVHPQRDAAVCAAILQWK